MTYETITPQTARERLASGDWTFLDVRTPQEFEAGHVPGAYNVPLLLAGPRGMQANPDFLATVQRHFQLGEALILGCRIGRRSAVACEELAGKGWTTLANMDGGFSGRRDLLGRLLVAGWEELHFPVDIDPLPGRSYAELRGAPEDSPS